VPQIDEPVQEILIIRVVLCTVRSHGLVAESSEGEKTVLLRWSKVAVELLPESLEVLTGCKL
jgi:hypothetical protein